MTYPTTCHNTTCPRNDRSESGCMDHSIHGIDLLCHEYRVDECKCAEMKEALKLISWLANEYKNGCWPNGNEIFAQIAEITKEALNGKD
jgi:hypothetical protein